MKYLENLNPEQQKAVAHVDGPLLILAGAGSGKTRVITNRIAYLIEEKGVYPSSILAITFTNKAAREMKERVGELIGNVSDMWISTFHAACVRILRRDIERLGNYNKNFVIFDTKDQESVVKETLKELNLNEKNFPTRSVISIISSAKDQLYTPAKFQEKHGHDFKMKKYIDIYTMYQQKLVKNNALDFDDILFKTVELLAYNEDILKYYQNKFKYILVDEYQDTNFSQYKLISLLAREHKNLCVVGDDDQSIYSWRGADIGNILNFEKDFPGTVVIKLEQNYRSTQTILDAANTVIRNNNSRKNKKLWTENLEGRSIIFFNAVDERAEAAFIMNEIERVTAEEGRHLNEFALLYRTNAQSRVLEEACMTCGLPYRIVGGFKFYDRKEVKDIIGYLRLIQNPNEDISFKRIINTPKRGIGNTSIDVIEQYARITGDSLYGAILDVEKIPGINKKATNSAKEFAKMMAEFMIASDTMKISQLLKAVMDKSGYLEEIKKDDEEGDSRLENIGELLSATMEFETKYPDAGLEDFLAQMALMSDIDNVQNDNEAIIMMTLHSAKGLEYPYVFITGLEEGLFPSQRSYFEEHQMEEERRLMYVGITRARERLYLTCAFERTIFGNTQYNSISKFVKEIPKELITKI